MQQGRAGRQPTFYWHDYETWGERPAQDRPSQFAGVRTDADLTPVGEPLMIYCRPPADLLPKPEACLVTGLAPQKVEAEGLCEAAFMARIAAELGQPGTCAVGYNSIRFDDEVTRYGLYRNFHDPYEREWKNGNSRWDIIDMVRMTRTLRPEGIEWPDYEDGSPCFRLEKLSEANGLAHDAAHDALSDVYATIALARLVKQRQPKLFDYAFKLRDKRFVAAQLDIDALKPVLHFSSMFAGAQGNCALMLPLAFHPSNKNSVIAYNLAFDPEPLLTESAEDLAQRLFSKSEDLPEGVERLALKEIHLNKSPMVVPPAMLDDATAERIGQDKDKCRQHWQRFYQLSREEREQLLKKLAAIYQRDEFVGSSDPEQQLYQGFFTDQDRALMVQVRAADPAELGARQWDFHDPRLPELLWRYRARNFPHTLSAEESERWRAFCYRRLTDAEAGASVVAEEFHARLSVLRQEPLSSSKLALLDQVEAYARQLIEAAR